MTTSSVAVEVTANNAEAAETVWIRVVSFGRLADQHHHKGDMLSASGRLVLTWWTGRDGEERTDWEMVTTRQKTPLMPSPKVPIAYWW